MSGWISLDRAITKHWLWQNEKFTKGQAWIDLLLTAAHTPNKKLIKGTLIQIARGEQIRSQVTLAKVWNWDRKTVSRFLKLLEKDGMITTRSDHLTSYISICNYDSFQDNKKDDAHLKGQQEGQQEPSREDTNNKGNKDDKVNNIDWDDLKNHFNSLMPNKKVASISDKRKKHIRSMLKSTGRDIDTLKASIEYAATTENGYWPSHRNGNTDHTGKFWPPKDFDFYMREATFLKTIED